MTMNDFPSHIAAKLESEAGLPVSCEAENGLKLENVISLHETVSPYGIGLKIRLGWRSVSIKNYFNSFFVNPALFEAWRNVASIRTTEIEHWQGVLKAMGAEVTFKVGDVTSTAISELAKDPIWESFSVLVTNDYVEAFDDAEIHEGNIMPMIACTWDLLLAVAGAHPIGSDGAPFERQSRSYERNPINRKLCIEANGYRCAVCGVDMEEQYGSLGKGFIEVHHVTPVSAYGGGKVIDPAKDLVPICPNCHSMIHRKTPPYSVEELKEMIRKREKKHDGNL